MAISFEEPRKKFESAMANEAAEPIMLASFDEVDAAAAEPVMQAVVGDDLRAATNINGTSNTRTTNTRLLTV